MAPPRRNVPKDSRASALQLWPLFSSSRRSRKLFYYRFWICIEDRKHLSPKTFSNVPRACSRQSLKLHRVSKSSPQPTVSNSGPIFLFWRETVYKHSYSGWRTAPSGRRWLSKGSGARLRRGSFASLFEAEEWGGWGLTRGPMGAGRDQPDARLLMRSGRHCRSCVPNRYSFFTTVTPNPRILELGNNKKQHASRHSRTTFDYEYWTIRCIGGIDWSELELTRNASTTSTNFTDLFQQYVKTTTFLRCFRGFWVENSESKWENCSAV